MRGRSPLLIFTSLTSSFALSTPCDETICIQRRAGQPARCVIRHSIQLPCYRRGELHDEHRSTPPPSSLPVVLAHAAWRTNAVHPLPSWWFCSWPASKYHGVTVALGRGRMCVGKGYTDAAQAPSPWAPLDPFPSPRERFGPLPAPWRGRSTSTMAGRARGWSSLCANEPVGQVRSGPPARASRPEAGRFEQRKTTCERRHGRQIGKQASKQVSKQARKQRRKQRKTPPTVGPKTKEKKNYRKKFFPRRRY